MDFLKADVTDTLLYRTIQEYRALAHKERKILDLYQLIDKLKDSPAWTAENETELKAIVDRYDMTARDIAHRMQHLNEMIVDWRARGIYRLEKHLEELKKELENSSPGQWMFIKRRYDDLFVADKNYESDN